MLQLPRCAARSVIGAHVNELKTANSHLSYSGVRLLREPD
jgi:hypothetical protein